MIGTVHNAQLLWDENDQPISESFDDVYFSKVSGLEETRFVFLSHNHLPERFGNLTAGDSFTIGETGFGTGLNFLCAWQLFERTAPNDCHLHFVSVEKFPLSKPDLIRALSLWPELSDYSKRLTELYPESFHSQFYRLKLAPNIHLTLIIDDAAEGFKALAQTDHSALLSENTKMDAWFLDGFAPAKNPEMWSDALFSAVHQLSDKRTSAATFTCAGLVKRGLENAGFALEKVPGFGRKREMLRAQFTPSQTDDRTEPYTPLAGNRPSPFRPTWPAINKAQSDNKTVLIIGAGLAGCHSARALAEQGFKVTVLERHAKPAQEGSGNPQGVLYAKLSAKSEKLSDFNLSALEFAQQHYQAFFDAGFGEQCGVLQLAINSKTQQHQANTAQAFESCAWLKSVSATQASAIAGIELTHAGLWFKKAGWLNPAAVCEQLLKHPQITSHFNCQITALAQTENTWSASGSFGAFSADICVIACANQASHFEQTRELQHKAIRGQVSYLPSTETSKKLSTVLCASGYIAPANQEQHCLGASFNLQRSDLDLDPYEHTSNLQHLEEFGPELLDAFTASNPKQLQGRVALRCTTPDYLPQVGPIANMSALNDDYQALAKNARSDIPQPGANFANLYSCFGFGSRGICYTPIAAEILCSHITGAPMPLAEPLITALHPARFAIRKIIRGT